MVPLEDIFVDPDLAKDKTTIAGVDSEYIETLDEVLCTPSSRVLLKGVAGSGKTTIVNHIMVQWSRHQGPLRFYDLALVVKLRDLSRNANIVNYIFDEILPVDGYSEAHRLLLRHCLRHSDHSWKVALVLDGLDEISDIPREIKDLIEKRVMSGVTLLLTTRDWKETAVNKYVRHVVELQGLSDSKLPTFIAKYLGEDPTTNTERFLREARNANVEDMLRVPFYCICLVLAWLHHSYELPKSRTLLNSVMVDMISVAFFNKSHHRFNLNALPQGLRELHATLSPGLDPGDLLEALPTFPVFFHLGRLALHGLLGNGRLYFTEDEVQRDLGNEAFQLGLLTRRKVYHNRRVKLILKFPHKSLQEFFSAIYIVHLISVLKDSSRVSEHAEAQQELDKLWCRVMDSHFVSEFGLVFTYCCGLCLDTAEVVLEEIYHAVSRDTKTTECCETIVQGTLITVVVSSRVVQHKRYTTNTIADCHLEAMQHPYITSEKRRRLTELAARAIDGCMVIFSGRSNLLATRTFLTECNAISELNERYPLKTVLLVWKEDVGDPSEIVKLLPVASLSCFWFMPRTTFTSDYKPMAPVMPAHQVQAILLHLSLGSQLRQLILIRVDLSQMSKFLAECLNGHKRLERLSMINNVLPLSFSPSLPEAIRLLPLTCIDLARNFDMHLLNANMPITIQELYLVFTSLDECSWRNLREKLPELTKLRTLYLSENPAMGAAFKRYPPEFARAPALEAIHVDNCGLDMDNLRELLPCVNKVKHVRTLDLSNNNLSFDSSLSEFVSSTVHLEALFITGNEVSDSVMADLQRTQQARRDQGRVDVNIDIFTSCKQWRKAWFGEYNQAFADF